MRCTVPYCLPLQATTSEEKLDVAKVQYILRIASGLNLLLYGSMEWNLEKNFSVEWNMKWKVFSME